MPNDQVYIYSLTAQQWRTRHLTMPPGMDSTLSNRMPLVGNYAYITDGRVNGQNTTDAFRVRLP